MLRNALWGLLLLGFVGCSNDHVETMKVDPAKVITWEALIELETGDNGLMIAGQAIDEKDWGRAQEYLKGPAFEGAIKKFEQAPLPGDWADRAEAKNEVVTQLKNLAQAVKAGAGQDKIESGWESLNAALAKLKEGPGGSD